MAWSDVPNTIPSAIRHRWHACNGSCAHPFPRRDIPGQPALTEDITPFSGDNGTLSPDPQDVQEVVRNSRTRQEAVELLKRALRWPTTPDKLGRYMGCHGLWAAWQKRRFGLTVPEVVKLIESAQTRKEGAEIISKARGRIISGDDLSVYLSRHKLVPPWRAYSYPPNADRVQEIIADTKSRRDALERLRAELGWFRSLRYFDGYVKEHKLNAPWQLHVPWHIDHSRMREVIQAARTLTDALELVREQLGRPMSRGNLRAYIKRNDIAVPWHDRRSGFATLETLRLHTCVWITMSVAYAAAIGMSRGMVDSAHTYRVWKGMAVAA